MSNVEVVSIDITLEERKDENAGKNKPSLYIRLKNFALSQLLSIGIILSITFGALVPRPAVYLNERIHFGKACLLVVMFTIGLRLKFREAKSAIKSYRLALCGLISVLFVRPIFSINVLNQIQFGPLIRNYGGQMSTKNTSSNYSAHEEMPILGPEEFRLALQIFSMCPSPVAISLIMVTTANGHRGLSILVSSVGTFLVVFISPPMLVWLIPRLKDLDIDVGKVVLHSVCWILLPMVIGRTLRFLSCVKGVIEKWDDSLRYIIITCITFIFLTKVSSANASGNFGRISPVNIVCISALGTSLATFYMIFVYGFLFILPCFSKKSTVTLSVLSSVSNMMVVIAIIDALPENTGDKGLLALPGIFISLTIIIVLNCFITFTKVQGNESEGTEDDHGFNIEKGETEITPESNVNPKVNEVTIFTIYTDEMSIEETKL